MKKIGIIGGGQLGLMLMEAGIPYSVRFSILDEETCSAGYLAEKHIIGSLHDKKAIKKLAKHSDILTYEIEHFNVDMVSELVKKGKIHCIPSPDILHIIQDKYKQKLFFEKHQIPTAPFVSVNSPKEWKKAAEKLNTHKFVAKLHKGGYDGKGVLICNASDITETFDAPCVIEKFIPCKHEIAVIVARNSHGNIAVYPAVEMVFDEKANLLKYLLCPARVSEKVAEQAKSIAVNVVECLQGIGIFAVEMFVTQEDLVLVNEIAPRPHNSGHHTIEACYTSQYEQLVRILLDLPLGSTDLIKPAVMLNLLGEKEHHGIAVYTGLEEALRTQGVYVHLYNKRETRPMRKMGHVTILGNTLQDAIQKAEQIQIKVMADTSN
jgi:5-(carboxyamino)imidazole ribonucleotide synthase